MKLLTKKDITSALITGLTTGIGAWWFLPLLIYPRSLPFDPILLVFVLPILWVIGVQLGYALGKFIPPFTQFGRFAAIGFANAAVDFGVLYLCIGLTGLAEGSAYSVFKAFSFFFATAHSYFWNKYWAFDAASTRGGKGEIGRFVGVALVSVLINVGAASAVVALRPTGMAAVSWAGIAAIVGSASALAFSFLGFRLFVFKR